MDERASQRGEYENFLIPQTPSASPLATQQGVSGGDEDASTYYVPAAQIRSPRREELRGKYQCSTTATMTRYTSANARYLSKQ